MKKEQFNVTGMTCAACSARVEKAVGTVPPAAPAWKKLWADCRAWIK